MSITWLERVELPNGQYADLLLRYPHDRAAMIVQAQERDQAVTNALLEEAGTKARAMRTTYVGWADMVLRASVWNAKLKHELTGEDIVIADGIDTGQIGMASDNV